MQIYGDLCHDLLATKQPRKLAYKEWKNYVEWKEQIRAKLLELVGMEKIAANACPSDFQIEEDINMDGYRRIRFTFESEKGAVVPAYLLIPDTGKEKYPVAICLQGHSSGFHNEIGVIKYERDKNSQPRAQHALQAVRNGFAALTIEQRAMGERKTSRYKSDELMCTYTAMTALQLGRTVLGERMWDVSRAIDQLANFLQLDLDKIAMLGGSGGGTATFYTACYDERIKLAIPSYAFCSYETSILNIFHCPCNYIPRASEWFEMQDLAALIAPRNLLVVAGLKDGIFPLTGVNEGFETVKRIYEKAGVSDKCRMLVTPEGHFWCEDEIWQAINEETAKLGW